MREEVWRRRKWLRLACARNQSWIEVRGRGRYADAGRGHQRVARRGERERDDERREHDRDRADHRLDLGADDPARRDRRGRDQIGRVLAGDREPGEPAGELPAAITSTGTSSTSAPLSPPKRATAAAPAAADRESASASARPARDRAAAASIPCAAARRFGEARRKPRAVGRCVHAAVGHSGRRDRVLAEARREHHDRGAEQDRRRRRTTATSAVSIAQDGARRPPHDAVDVRRERDERVRLQEGEIATACRRTGSRRSAGR